jgi:stage III sporulation protein SpoIIIAA
MKETLNSRVAVVETKLEALTAKLDEVRDDIKEVHACLHKTRELILNEIKTLRQEDNVAHKDMGQRIMNLENWRWYVIGIATAAGILAKYLFGV